MENDYWKADNIQDQIQVAPMVINVNQLSSSSYDGGKEDGTR